MLSYVRLSSKLGLRSLRNLSNHRYSNSTGRSPPTQWRPPGRMTKAKLTVFNQQLRKHKVNSNHNQTLRVCYIMVLELRQYKGLFTRYSSINIMNQTIYHRTKPPPVNPPGRIWENLPAPVSRNRRNLTHPYNRVARLQSLGVLNHSSLRMHRRVSGIFSPLDGRRRQVGCRSSAPMSVGSQSQLDNSASPQLRSVFLAAQGTRYHQRYVQYPGATRPRKWHDQIINPRDPSRQNHCTKEQALSLDPRAVEGLTAHPVAVRHPSRNSVGILEVHEAETEQHREQQVIPSSYTNGIISGNPTSASTAPATGHIISWPHPRLHTLPSFRAHLQLLGDSKRS
mgnify:CR=1 FL=1